MALILGSFCVYPLKDGLSQGLEERDLGRPWAARWGLKADDQGDCQADGEWVLAHPPPVGRRAKHTRVRASHCLASFPPTPCDKLKVCRVLPQGL